ncbi:hypothetical protein [Streptomyces sp. IBSBF 2806]|uniref:hypothetical protein n=1 Tax=Streptomyces sp. IBSBF 2806 TaxID=2903529 RepID=UPI002FDC12BE
MSKTRLTAVAAVVAAVGLLAACGGSDDSSKPAAASSRSATASAGGEGSKSTSPAKSATSREVFTDLSGGVAAAKLNTVVTAENDPNKLLGRPHQYSSKVTFTDSRIAASDVEGLDKDDTLRGGAVEVFESAEDAKARADYIESVTKSLPMLAEYHYLSGPVLVRVSHYLTPQQAGEYKAALDRG